MKHGYHDNIEKVTLENENFRKVLYTGAQSQLVVMTLKPGQEIGMEIHPNNDQFFRFEAGSGRVIVDETQYEVSDGHAVIIPASANHNVINTSDTELLKMYTIYSPAHHRDGVIHVILEDAVSDDEDFDGTTTE